MKQTEASLLIKEIETKIIELSHDMILNHAPKDSLLIGLKMQTVMTSIEKKIIDMVED